MNASLKISSDFNLPLKFLSLRKVVFGGSGSGKTASGRVLFEEATAAGVLCGAVDLKGDWWGLKSTADGRGDGIPIVIFGGEHQDIPLDENGGASLAEIVVDLRQPFVVDLEQLSKGKQLRFLGAFFDRLYDRNREPLVLFCDEADRYAPQKPMSPEANICLGAAEDIAKRGRKHGIFPVFITQRNASLNKGVSELCDVAMAFRTPGPRDQEAVEHWFGTKATREQRDEVMGKLAGLATGTAVLCSAHPDLKLFQTVPIRMPRTFDSSATPEIGKRAIVPKRLAQPDLEQLRARMAATIEKARAEDPKALRRELAAALAEITRLGAAKPAPAAKERIERVEVPVLKLAEIKRLEDLASRVEGALTKLGGIRTNLDEDVAALRGVASEILATVQTKLAPTPAPVIPVRREQPTHAGIGKVGGPTGSEKAWVPPQSKSEGRRRVIQAGGSDLAKGERAVLTAVAQHGEQGVTREQLTVLTGYKRSSRDTYLQRLGAQQMVQTMGNSQVVTTAAGLDALGPDFEPLPTGEALRAHWIRELPEGERRILAVLLEAYPKALEREVISEHTQYLRSSRDTYLQRLRARQLVTTEGRGAVRAADTLFEGVA